jgi:hypothetical protein
MIILSSLLFAYDQAIFAQRMIYKWLPSEIIRGCHLERGHAVA